MSRGGTRIYFGRLPRDVRERDIEKFIRGYGHYREISIKLGYGFVEFDDSKDADDCVYELNGKELLGERIVVEHARNPVRSVDYGYRSRDSRDNRDSYRGDNRKDTRRGDQPRRGRTPPVRTEHRLAVMNLSSRCNWQDLKEFMGKHGEVTFADAHKRRQGEGVVEFSTKEDMKTAMKKQDDEELFGRHIKLKIEKVKSRHSGSRSRSRSRSPSRSRRKSRSRSHSRSPKRRRHSSSDQRSRSKHSRSRSTSPSKDKKSKSRSKTPEDRSRSGSPKKDVENGDEELKEVEDVEEELDEEQPEQTEENGDEENGEENMDDEEAEEKKKVDADDDDGDVDDA